MSIHTLFSTYIYQQQLQASGIKKLNQNLLSECYKIKDYDIEGQDWSKQNYVGGYTSYSSMDSLHQFSSSFNKLKEKIDKHVHRYVKHLQFDLKKDRYDMTDCWINIMPAQVMHANHIHPLSFISGTYYIQTPKQSAAIKFEDPRLARMMAAPVKKQSCTQSRHHSLNVKAGDIVLFESWLAHEVPAAQNTQDRISVSFNYAWS